MAFGRKKKVSEDLQQLATLAEAWCITNDEIDLPMHMLLEWSVAISPATVNPALHKARICRAVNEDVLVAIHPTDRVALPYVTPQILYDVVLRVPNITSKVNMEAFLRKREAKIAEEQRKLAELRKFTLEPPAAAPLADSVGG